MTELSATAKAILEAYDNSPFAYDTGDQTAVAAVLRALVDKISYEYHYHMDDGEGGIQYNCKNTIIDENELNEIIHELEALK